MAKIAAHHEWLMKEYVLGLLRSYPMPFQFLWVLASSQSNPKQFSNGSTAATNLVYDHRIRAGRRIRPSQSALAWGAWLPRDLAGTAKRVRLKCVAHVLLRGASTHGDARCRVRRKRGHQRGGAALGQRNWAARERPARAQLPTCTACDNGRLLDEPPAQIL